MTDLRGYEDVVEEIKAGLSDVRFEGHMGEISLAPATSRNRRWTPVWLAALTISLVAVAFLPSWLVDPTPAASVVDPVQPELIYESKTLTEDHVGGIGIKADNVTLNCAGHSIIWDPADEEAGILIEGQSGVTVKNCVVEGFENGIHITGSSDILVVNTVSRSTLNGFFVGGFHPEIPEYESHHITLTNNHAIGINPDDGFGFLIEGGHDITLQNNVATGHFDNGFRMRGPSHDNLLLNNRAESNGSHGFEIHGYYDDATKTEYPLVNNVLRGNIAVSNGVLHGGGGFQVGELSRSNLLEGNHASNNTWFGFNLVEGATENTLEGNHSLNNDEWGFLVYESSTDNTLVANRSVGNRSGVLLGEYSSGNVLESNIICNNEEANLEYDETSEPTLINNKVCGNPFRN